MHEILRKAPGELHSTVQIIGSPSLSSRYLDALELLGIPALAWAPDSDYTAALRALFNIYR